MLKKLSLTTTPDLRGQRLDQVLSQWLPEALARPVSKAKARKLIVAGAVYLNGSRVRIASKELVVGARLDVYVDAAKLFEQDGRAMDRAFEMTADRVLFEDEYVIVVDKPPGLPTQPTLDEARDNLFAAVKRFIARRDGAADPYLALHHRLDRDTSGVILFAKAKEANAGVARMFSEHLAQKTYYAIVSVARGRKLGADWVTRNFLGKLSGHSGHGKSARYGAVRSGGDPAETRFKLLEAWPGAAWLQAMPITGRTHQIRVHLAEAGMPIFADHLYGGAKDAAPRLMLHAAILTFPHPIHQTDVSIQAPVPEDFSQCVARQRKPIHEK